MESNVKLSLKQRVQRSIRRRRQISPFWYLGAAAVLIGLCVLLRYAEFKKTLPEYHGLAETGKYTITFTGNISCVGDGKTIDAEGYKEYFEGVTGIFSNSDYVSVALNDPIITDDVEVYESGMSKKFAARYFNVTMADAMKEIGVRDVSICNEDIFRYLSKGARETSQTLETKGMNVAGIGRFHPHVFVGDLEVIHIGMEASFDRQRDYIGKDYDLRTYNPIDEDYKYDIAALRKVNPDAFIVVSVSWAEHYLLKPSKEMKDLCRSLIDSGADLVVGTGVQMVLTAEKYNDGYIFYGLGNLVANEAYTMTQRGVVLNCVFDENGDVTYELVPLSVKDGRPVITQSAIILRTLVSDIGKGADYHIENGKLILK